MNNFKLIEKDGLHFLMDEDLDKRIDADIRGYIDELKPLKSVLSPHKAWLEENEITADRDTALQLLHFGSEYIRHRVATDTGERIKGIIKSPTGRRHQIEDAISDIPSELLNDVDAWRDGLRQLSFGRPHDDEYTFSRGVLSVSPEYGKRIHDEQLRLIDDRQLQMADVIRQIVTLVRSIDGQGYQLADTIGINYINGLTFPVKGVISSLVGDYLHPEQVAPELTDLSIITTMLRHTALTKAQYDEQHQMAQYYRAASRYIPEPHPEADKKRKPEVLDADVDLVF